ncbi:MAG: hypothetical protein RBR53_02780 [Desulforegulaceae bacterium]|nr:hypothetical protein [Desulforegulaceae bacterium]
MILPYDQMETRYIKVPKTNEKEAENAVYWTLKKEIDFDIKNYFLDFKKTETITEKGVTKEGTCAYIAKKSTVYSIKSLFEKSGFNVVGITSIPFAVRAIVENEKLRQGPKNICFINPRNDSLEIYIFTKGYIKLVRQTKTGIMSLAESLILNALENNNEEIKSKTPEELTEIILEHIKSKKDNEENNEIDKNIESTIERIARQVERTVNYYNNQIHSDNIEAVIVNGVLADYPPLTEMIARYTETNVFSSLDIINESVAASHKNEIFKNNDFLTALGSIYCSNKNTPNILFTQRHQKASKTITLANRAVFAGVFLTIIFCTGFYFVQKNQISNLKQKKQNLENQLSKYQPKINSSMLSEKALETRKNKGFLKEKAKKMEPRVLLKEFSDFTCENIKIKDLKLNLDLDDKKEEIFFSGYVFGEEFSLNSILANYIQDLRSSGLFTHVSLESQNKLTLDDKTIIAFSALIKI